MDFEVRDRLEQLERRVKELEDIAARAQMYADQAAAYAADVKAALEQLQKPNPYPGEAISGGGPNP